MKFNAANRQSLRPVEELFGTQAPADGVLQVALSRLHAFRQHPFSVHDDDEMTALVESIREHGILSPIVVRPKGMDYEILSGHRRTHAAQKLGLQEVPVLVRELDDDAATILMVDSNLQREKILPSEKAAAYKLRMEAMKRQAGRRKQNADQIERDLIGHESRDLLAEQVGESAGQIQRYVRLNYLQKELLDAVDVGIVPLNAGVALSYLTEEEQKMVAEAYRNGKIKLTLAKANELKDASRLGTLQAMLKVGQKQDVSRENKRKPVEIRMSSDVYRRFFGERIFM